MQNNKKVIKNISGGKPSPSLDRIALRQGREKIRRHNLLVEKVSNVIFSFIFKKKFDTSF